MTGIATSSLVNAVVIASIVSTVVLGLIPSIVCWLKGKRRWAVLGFFTAWHIVAAFRLARPDSWWARRFYNDQKLEQALERFRTEPDVGLSATPSAKPDRP